jgi:hypothetical protein
MSDGLKHDTGKTLVGQMFKDFPHALEAVAEVTTYGAKTYGLGSWRGVSVDRYENAEGRHLLAAYKGQERDPESGLRHLAHKAWNALAELQKAIEEEGNKCV